MISTTHSFLRLVIFKDDLHGATKPILYPIPKLCHSAVKFTMWMFLVFGAIAAQPINDEEEVPTTLSTHLAHNRYLKDVWWIFEVRPTTILD